MSTAMIADFCILTDITQYTTQPMTEYCNTEEAIFAAQDIMALLTIAKVHMCFLSIFKAIR